MNPLAACPWQAVLLSLTLGASGSRGGSEEILLRNDRVSLAVDSASGCIVRIQDASSGMALAPPPGKSFDGAPVVLGLVDGDWRAAGKVYREWFRKTFGIVGPSGDWIRRQSFFLMTMFMLPEGTINYTFSAGATGT